MGILKMFLLLVILMMSGSVASMDQEEYQKAVDEYVGILAQILAIAPSKVPLAGSVVEILKNIIVVASNLPDGDLWTQIEARVANKIGKSLTGYHLSDIRADLQLFTLKIAKGSKFSKDDLDYIMTRKLRMVPQNYDTLAFSTQLATLLPAWTGYMVAGQLQMIKQGIKKKCDLAAELTKLRDETIQAAKSLVRKRFEGITGTGFYRGSPDRGCAGRGIPCRNMARFKLEDGATGTTHDKVVGNVMYRVYSDLREETVDALMKLLVNPINKFFQQKICLSGCPCPSAITRSDIVFYLPLACHGKTKQNKRCSIPCHAYGSTYTWCPSYGYKIPSNNLMTRADWDECTPANFDTCMPVKSVLLY